MLFTPTRGHDSLEVIYDQMRAESVEYINEIHRLRDINSELLEQIQILKQSPDVMSDAYNDELDRNSELEEMMVTQRRQLVSLERQLDEASVVITNLRKKCRRLKKQNAKQKTGTRSCRTSALFQNRWILKPLPFDGNMCHSDTSKLYSSLEMSVTSPAEQDEISILDSVDCTSSFNRDEFLAECSGTSLWSGSIPPTPSYLNGSIEAGWSTKCSDNLTPKKAFTAALDTKGKSASPKHSVDETIKKLQQEKQELADKHERWIRYINVQAQKAQMKGFSFWDL